jgi:hypothetical protein
MSLSAREQQALDSIKDGLAGSDPQLAALLSAFNRLASDEDMPDREKIQADSRRALRRLRRGPRGSSLRSVCKRLAFQHPALLLWLATTAVLIAVALIAVALTLNGGGDHGTCTEEAVVLVCAGPTTGHSPGSPSHNTTTSQAPKQPAAGIPQAGP